MENTSKNELILFKSKNEVASSLHTLFADYESEKAKIEQISKLIHGKESAVSYFMKGNDSTVSFAENLFGLKGAISALDAEFWTKAMNMTDVYECMPAEERNKWDKQISDMTTVPFEKDTVIATLYSLLGTRDKFMAQKIDGVFRKLSDTHVTNNPSAFRSRMILKCVMNEKYESLNSEVVAYITDLRGVIAKLMGREFSRVTISSQLNEVIRKKTYGEWVDFDGGSFKIKLFRKGTAHIEVHETMALQLNSFLAALYPMVIADSSKAHVKKGQKESPVVELRKDLISLEVCSHLSTIADYVRKGRPVSLDYLDIPVHCVTAVEDVLKYLDGKSKNNLWSFEYDASEALNKIARLGYLPEKTSHQFYPTKAELAQKVVDLAEITDKDQVLEPSAGLGGIAKLLPRKQTTCVEIDPVHGEVLNKLGFKSVEVADFMKYKTSTSFDKIVMNPPFTKGQAQRHLLKASELLSTKGKLVAILPASLKGKHLVEGRTHKWSEVICEAFEGTKVSVVILELT